jgi:hypothetical protein
MEAGCVSALGVRVREVRLAPCSSWCISVISEEHLLRCLCSGAARKRRDSTGLWRKEKKETWGCLLRVMSEHQVVTQTVSDVSTVNI